MNIIQIPQNRSCRPYPVLAASLLGKKNDGRVKVVKLSVQCRALEASIQSTDIGQCLVNDNIIIANGHILNSSMQAD
jgi:hypothetical protein